MRGKTLLPFEVAGLSLFLFYTQDPPLGRNANPKPIVFGEVFAFVFYL